MSNEDINVKNIAVQLRSSTNPELILSAKERKEISDASMSDFKVYWLPPIAKGRPPLTFGHHEVSIILIIILGVSFNLIAKPFIESISRKAGEDFWEAVKGLLGRIWKKQSEIAYNLDSDAYIIFEYNNSYIAVHLRLPFLVAGQTRKDDDYDKIIRKSLESLANSWDDIISNIEKFNIGSRAYSGGLTNTTVVHVITKSKGNWIIYPTDSETFFSRHKIG